jgi:outer membrane protein OmpU
MKKILIASTALTMLAGVASADVTLSGSGYFGLGYDKNGTTTFNGVTKKTTTGLIDRTQIDIKASKTTDSGLTFFGTFRIRDGAYNVGPTPVNGGMVGVKAGGFEVDVGNATDAIDAMNTYYNSEIGICGCGGETLSIPFATSLSRGHGFDGVLASYTMGGLVARVSYLETNGQGQKGQTGVSVDYKMGALQVGAGYTVQPNVVGGTAKFNGYVLTGEYALGTSTIGMAYGHNNNANKGIVTLYGSTTFGATTVQAFVSQAGGMLAGETTKTTYGVGGKYNLGSGAAIVGHIRTDRTKDTLGDIGVTFSF